MHVYLVGQTGTGKTTLLGNLSLQDADQGTGFCLIDPHGDLAQSLVKALGERVTYWNIADPVCPLGYNPLAKVSTPIRPLIASGLIDTLKKQWADAWGVRMEHLLRYAVLALLDTETPNLQDILRLFLDRDFRKRVISEIQDSQVRQFWTKEYPAMNYKNAADGLAPIANKLGAFLAHPTVRRAICAPQEPLRFGRFMDEGRGLVINLAKGHIGSDVSNVVGGLLTSSIIHAAFSRQGTDAEFRSPFMLYIDEFHSFTSEAVVDLLAETRKYGLGAVLSQQHTAQASPAVLASVLGNAGTLISFRIGTADAPLIASQLGCVDPAALQSQPNYRAVIRLLVNGEPTRPFSMTTLPPSARRYAA